MPAEDLQVRPASSSPNTMPGPVPRVTEDLQAIMIAADVVLGHNAIIFQPGLVNLYGCTVGDGSRIGAFVEIQKGARIGSNCKISSHSFICSGVTIEDGVFIGHGVMFTNDRYPGAVNQDGSLQTEADWLCTETQVGAGASVGSNATILPGVRIGPGALVGAGAVVTKVVPAYAIVAGVPARVISTRTRDEVTTAAGAQ
jgi:acetyltransferase-like isoleucine patch superfamily enzyme